MARSFNGTTDFADNATGLNITGDMTISCWIFYSSSGRLYSNWGATFTVQQSLLDIAGGKAQFARQDGTGIYKIATGATALSASTWYHVLGTCNSTNGAEIWLNGSQDAVAATSMTAVSIAQNLRIGAERDGTGIFFGGSIADMCVWNVALKSNEIISLSKGTRPYLIQPASIKGLWDFDGLQSPEPDYSGSRLNMTLTGTALANGPPITLFTPKSRTSPVIQTPVVSTTIPWPMFNMRAA